jgi:hypothetical protein
MRNGTMLLTWCLLLLLLLLQGMISLDQQEKLKELADSMMVAA